MILRSASILWLIYLICAIRLNLVCAVTYTKDQLLNVDLEPQDRWRGLMWDWENMYLYSRPYYQYRMEMSQQVGNEAQIFLNDLKTLVDANDTVTYYRNMAKKNQDYFQLVQDSMIASLERIMISPGENEQQRTRQCLAIANTMLNSRLDIQRYYKIRYLYTWTLHYEIGYLSQEILRHYTVAIDLFHLVVTRFDKYRLDDHTPARYMLYMYSVILQECKMIIKLCRMIHEVKKKYTNFVDHTKLWRDTPGSDEQLINEQNRQREANDKAWRLYNSELEKARANKMRLLKKQQKKALNAFKGSLGGPEKGNKISGSGFGASGKKEKNEKGKWKPADYFYVSVNASDQKRSKYPHIYGWSVENFPPPE